MWYHKYKHKHKSLKHKSLKHKRNNGKKRNTKYLKILANILTETIIFSLNESTLHIQHININT